MVFTCMTGRLLTRVQSCNASTRPCMCCVYTQKSIDRCMYSHELLASWLVEVNESTHIILCERCCFRPLVHCREHRAYLTKSRYAGKDELKLSRTREHMRSIEHDEIKTRRKWQRVESYLYRYMLILDCLDPREHGRPVYIYGSFVFSSSPSFRRRNFWKMPHALCSFDMIICARSMRKGQLFWKRRDAGARYRRKFSEKLEPPLQHAGWKLMRKVARLEVHARKLSFLLYLATHKTYG
jgi:hypothetical protein